MYSPPIALGSTKRRQGNQAVPKDDHKGSVAQRLRLIVKGTHQEPLAEIRALIGTDDRSIEVELWRILEPPTLRLQLQVLASRILVERDRDRDPTPLRRAGATADFADSTRFAGTPASSGKTSKPKNLCGSRALAPSTASVSLVISLPWTR